MDNGSFTLAETGVAFPGGLSADVLMDTVRQAEADGFRSCWISEDYFNGGAMATAGALAAVTSRIELGVGVVNPYTRTPVLTAMEAAAVDAVSRGRFLLAMGSSNRRWIEEKMCIPFEKPITHVAESVEMIRTLIGTGWTLTASAFTPTMWPWILCPAGGICRYIWASVASGPWAWQGNTPTACCCPS